MPLATASQATNVHIDTIMVAGSIDLPGAGDGDGKTFVWSVLSDDTSPIGDPEDEAAPLYLYVGEKDANSVAASSNGVVAVAISRDVVDQSVFGETVALSQPGFVALYDADTLALLSTIDVGNLPDNLTFSEDGKTLVVAGEGEKNEDSNNDDNPSIRGTLRVANIDRSVVLDPTTWRAV